ncbi:MAG TPA: SH3 domain-containing protein [Symbiobacteriaceae bacterium]|nr:SH3 domain-containing protein [Symbiobacteriaceae bacterium]
MRRLWVPLLLVMMIVVGCTKPAVPPPPAPGETGGSEPPVPGPVTAPGQDGPAAPGGDLRALVTAAPANTFQHHQIKPGEAIDRLGIFVMKTATGEVEGWSLGEELANSAHYDISTDNRWVSAWAGDQAYLLDRKSGTAYRWGQNYARLVAARGESLLFRTDTRFWIASADLKRIIPVALQEKGWSQALIAPDGQAAFLINGPKIYRLETASGAVQEAGTVEGQREYTITWLAPRGGQVLAGVNGEVQRYDWAGKELGRQSLPDFPWFSPDGRLVAWPSNILGIADAMAVAASQDLTPKFRLISIDRCGDAGPTGDPWLADSSGLVVRTGNGQGYQILGADGTLTPFGPLEGERSWYMPVPAPDRPDWFAVGGSTVVDRQGRQVVAAVPHSEGNWYGVSRLAPWGESSEEVRFELINWGKDFGCLPAVFPPEVQMAPFPVITGLEVTVPTGDCVNLRLDANLRAPVITCLPNGTKLTGSTPPGRLNKGYLERVSNPTVTDMGGDGWWFVRTETGQRGWVRLSGEYLKLAVARPGAPAPDPVADLIRDEKENLLWWFNAAEGKTECGPACAGLTSWEAPVWALAESCRQSGDAYGYEYIRKEPGFDSARHEEGVKGLQGACKALQDAWAKLGEPTDTPAWREVIANVKAGIERQ